MNNLIIIGSGPAGLTSAIYASRAQLNPIVIEGMEPGGQLTTTTVIENWPGYPDGVDAQTLMSDMREQAKRFGTEFISDEVTKIDLKKTPFTLTVGAEKRDTNAVIIATGAFPKMLGLSEEKKLIGRGVSTCATCDGFFFREKEVLVIGGGDTAMEEAIYLSTLAKNVTVIHRRDELRASKIMQEKAKSIKNINFTWNSVVAEIHDLQKNTVTGASIKNIKTGKVFLKECDGIFIGLGHIPNSDFLDNQLELDVNGFIVTRNGSKTSVPGVFAAGDVSDPVYKQAITSAGKGCMAALDAEKFIRRLE
jgi:thioredoxin reductase (NADPH)